MLLRHHRLGRRKSVPLYRLASICLVTLVFLFSWLQSFPSSELDQPPVRSKLDIHAKGGPDAGGEWYIPSFWFEQSSARSMEQMSTANMSILAAAELASEFALQKHKFLNDSHIPLVVHQTWKSLDANTWPEVIQEGIDKWVGAATQGGETFLQGPQMAWFLWSDHGVDSLIEKFEPSLYEDFHRLPYPVEKADVFRVVVLKWLGGIYADVDSEPLKHPFNWIHHSDLLPWIEPQSQRSHALYEPTRQAYGNIGGELTAYNGSVISECNKNSGAQPVVNAIFGIEADNHPAPDTTYWRMGYSFPVQVTNWALAMGRHHPVADQFIFKLRSAISQHRHDLPTVDPLDITGPPALTAAIRNVAQLSCPEFSWDALTGRDGDQPGGRGKVVAGDTLILPITGFNPGRGWFQNMGSQDITHENARLRHAAAGSWRTKYLKVEYGKLCRQLFGLCRDWKKIPDA